MGVYTFRILRPKAIFINHKKIKNTLLTYQSNQTPEHPQVQVPARMGCRLQTQLPLTSGAEPQAQIYPEEPRTHIHAEPAARCGQQLCPPSPGKERHDPEACGAVKGHVSWATQPRGVTQRSSHWRCAGNVCVCCWVQKAKVQRIPTSSIPSRRSTQACKVQGRGRGHRGF